MVSLIAYDVNGVFTRDLTGDLSRADLDIHGLLAGKCSPETQVHKVPKRDIGVVAYASCPRAPGFSVYAAGTSIFYFYFWCRGQEVPSGCTLRALSSFECVLE